jgi:hypothetical protein
MEKRRDYSLASNLRPYAFPKKGVVSRKLGSLVRYNMARTGLRSGNSYFIPNYSEEKQPTLLYAVA